MVHRMPRKLQLQSCKPISPAMVWLPLPRGAAAWEGDVCCVVKVKFKCCVVMRLARKAVVGVLQPLLQTLTE